MATPRETQIENQILLTRAELISSGAVADGGKEDGVVTWRVVDADKAAQIMQAAAVIDPPLDESEKDVLRVELSPMADVPF